MERIVDSMERYAEAGTTHLQIATPPGPETEDILEQLDLFVTEIRPQALLGERGGAFELPGDFLRTLQPGQVGGGR